MDCFFRISGLEGLEGIVVVLEVTRVCRDVISVASNQLGIRNSGLEVFSTEKPFREVS